MSLPTMSLLLLPLLSLFACQSMADHRTANILYPTKDFQMNKQDSILVDWTSNWTSSSNIEVSVWVEKMPGSWWYQAYNTTVETSQFPNGTFLLQLASVNWYLGTIQQNLYWAFVALQDVDDPMLDEDGLPVPRNDFSAVNNSPAPAQTYKPNSIVTNTPTASSTASRTATAGATASGDSNSGLSDGAKIGIGIGVALGVLALIALGVGLWFIRRRRAKKAPVPSTVGGDSRYYGIGEGQSMMSGVPSSVASPAWMHHAQPQYGYPQDKAYDPYIAQQQHMSQVMTQPPPHPQPQPYQPIHEMSGSQPPAQEMDSGQDTYLPHEAGPGR